MGLFDEVVGAFLKGDAGKYQAILSWVEEQGGIQVLLEKDLPWLKKQDTVLFLMFLLEIKVYHLSM